MNGDLIFQEDQKPAQNLCVFSCICALKVSVSYLSQQAANSSRHSNDYCILRKLWYGYIMILYNIFVDISSCYNSYGTNITVKTNALIDTK